MVDCFICGDSVEVKIESVEGHREFINAVKVDKGSVIGWHRICACAILMSFYFQGFSKDEKARRLHREAIKYMQQSVTRLKAVPQEFTWVD